MGVTKKNNYTSKQLRLAAISKVFGHPARVAIFEYLLKVQTCICGEIVDEIGLSQPTISQHLREMKEVGLITGNIEGTKVCYCINRTVYQESKELIESLFNHKIETNKPSC